MNVDESVLSGKKLVDIAVEKALGKKAENIVVFNPGSKSGIAEWFLVCQGDNVVQNKAIANAILIGLKEDKTVPWYKEGFEEGRWILLDYSDVIINILLPEARDYYELEELWEDFPRIDISDDG